MIGIANAMYEDGRVFASVLYRVGGTELLDAAYKALPTTALEILYPDLYLAGIKEQPLAELDAALEAEGIAKKTREHAGAFRVARTFAADAEAELTGLLSRARARLRPRSQIRSKALVTSFTWAF